LIRTFCHIAINILLLSFAALGIADYLNFGDDDASDDAAIVSPHRSTDEVIAPHAGSRAPKRIPEKSLPEEDSESRSSSAIRFTARTGQELLHLLSLQRK
jgi:hypothetical protein